MLETFKEITLKYLNSVYSKNWRGWTAS